MCSGAYPCLRRGEAGCTCGPIRDAKAPRLTIAHGLRRPFVADKNQRHDRSDGGVRTGGASDDVRREGLRRLAPDGILHVAFLGRPGLRRLLLRKDRGTPLVRTQKTAVRCDVESCQRTHSVDCFTACRMRKTVPRRAERAGSRSRKLSGLYFESRVTRPSVRNLCRGCLLSVTR